MTFQIPAMTAKERNAIRLTLRPYAYTKTQLIGCPYCGVSPVQCASKTGVILVCLNDDCKNEVLTSPHRTIGAVEAYWVGLVDRIKSSMQKQSWRTADWSNMRAAN